MKRSLLLLPLLLLLLTACSSDDYETGDSAYSYLKAELVEAYTDSYGNIVRVGFDDDGQMMLSQALATNWASTADSVYRALLYFNQYPTPPMNQQLVPVSIGRVPVLIPKEAADFEGGMKTDPLGFQSAWLGTNKKYLNLGLILKSGVPDDKDAVQGVGVEKVSETSQMTILRLYHDQGGVPEYYSSRVFVSIPVKSALTSDSVTILINTYKGVVERKYKIK